MEVAVPSGSSRDLLVAPGASVAEALEEHNLTCSTAAEAMQLNEQYLAAVIDGTANITEELADRLTDLVGIRKSFWLNLQSYYDEKLRQIELRERAESRKKHAVFSPAVTLKNGKKMYALGRRVAAHKSNKMTYR